MRELWQLWPGIRDLEPLGFAIRPPHTDHHLATQAQAAPLQKDQQWLQNAFPSQGPAVQNGFWAWCAPSQALIRAPSGELMRPPVSARAVSPNACAMMHIHINIILQLLLQAERQTPRQLRVVKEVQVHRTRHLPELNP